MATTTQCIFEIPEVNITTGATLAWVDYDVSAYVPPGATGVLLHIVNTDATYYSQCRLRKKGSTDTLSPAGVSNLSHTWAGIGIDANRIFQAYRSRSACQIWLVGYTSAGVTWFTDGIPYVFTAGSWQSVDASSDAPVGTTGLIWYIWRDNTNYEVGFRATGSSDNRINQNYGSNLCTAFVKADAGRTCQLYRGNAAVYFYLIGYITDGFEFNTDGVDLSLTNTGSFEDLNFNPDEPQSPVFIEVVTPNGTARYFDLRMDGDSDSHYQRVYYHNAAMVGAYGGEGIEGKIETTGVDFFHIGGAPIWIQTLPADPIAAFEAVGNVYLVNSDEIDEFGIEWGTVIGTYPNSETTTDSDLLVDGARGFAMTGLTPSTAYYFRAKAHHTTHGWLYGAVHSFTTTAITVITLTPTGIGATTAIGRGYADDTHADQIGVEWGKVQGGPYTDENTLSADGGDFELAMTGLTASTTYYYRAKAHYTAGWVYGSEVSFDTIAPFPVALTEPPSDTGDNDFVAEGSIYDTGGDAYCDERGFVYGLTSKDDPGNTAPSLSGYDGYTTESGTFTTGDFSALISGLTISKIYYFRAYAKNPTYGYDYGQEILVVTNPNVNILYPTGDASLGIRFDTSPGGGYPHPLSGTVDHAVLVRNADAEWNSGSGKWGGITGDYVYEYNYANDNYYTDLYTLADPIRRDVGIVKVKWKARVGRNTYPYGKFKRELKTHSTQYTGNTYNLRVLHWECEIFYNNPYTGSAWTLTELDDLQAGITLGNGGSFGIPFCDCLLPFALWANAEARTDPATTLDTTSFRLNGTVIEDEAEECEVYFEYGPDTGYGYTTTPETKVKGDTFQADVDIGESEIHFRAVISTQECGETFYGSDRTAPEEDGIGGTCFFKDYIVAGRTEIGWDQELQQATAGIGEFIVDNSNGDFNSENPAGAFYGTLALGVEIVFSEVYNGVEYVHFTGKIAKIVPNDDPNEQTAYILCIDGMDDIAGTEVSTALREDTNVGELCEDVLDAIGWPAADREIDSGVDTLDAGWFHKKPGLQAIRDLELTEKGRAWVKPNGKFRFEDRHYRITGDGLVSQHDFEDTAIRIEYEWSKRLLYNEISVTGRRYFSGGVQLFSGYDLATIESALIWSAHTGDSGAPYIPQGTTVTIWAETQSPIYEYTTMVKGTHWNANTAADKSGTDVSDNITITETQYGQAVKLEIQNTGGVGAYIVEPDSPPDPGSTDDRALLIYGVLFSAENINIIEEDTDSQDSYGKKTLSINAPFKSKPNDVLAYAQWLLQRYHEPIPNPVQVFHVARTNWPDDTIRVQCLARHISDRITIKSTRLGMDRDFYIDKVIQEYVRNEGGFIHNTTWVVESAEGSAEELYWLLGVAGFGELGQTTRLGF